MKLSFEDKVEFMDYLRDDIDGRFLLEDILQDVIDGKFASSRAESILEDEVDTRVSGYEDMSKSSYDNGYSDGFRDCEREKDREVEDAYDEGHRDGIRETEEKHSKDDA